MDSYTKWRLENGLDDIGLTLRHTDLIDEFELARPGFAPTLT
jgi:3-isopropylmalate/(R)-2-methylmalate dehydratase small subunit